MYLARLKENNYNILTNYINNPLSFDLSLINTALYCCAFLLVVHFYKTKKRVSRRFMWAKRYRIFIYSILYLFFYYLKPNHHTYFHSFESIPPFILSTLGL